MFKQDAINYFGSKSKLAKAAGVAPASVSVWGDLVPEKMQCACKLHRAVSSNMTLKFMIKQSVLAR